MIKQLAASISVHVRQPFGAVMDGFDMPCASAADIAQLKHLLSVHGVVVLRCALNTLDASDQVARDAAFVVFLKRLGQLTFTVGETPVVHQPMLNVVSNVGRSTPPKSVFHTDTSYVRNTPAYTALRPLELPASGGETVFSDQFWAYEALPQAVKQRFADVQVLHRVSGLPADTPGEAQTWHPLFKVHPLSGKTALFLSTPKRCVALSGIPEPQAQRYIDLLYRHSTRHYRAMHHHWRAGDVLIWDNRCTMHRGDHAQVVGNRVFHRGMVLPEDV